MDSRSRIRRHPVHRPQPTLDAQGGAQANAGPYRYRNAARASAVVWGCRRWRQAPWPEDAGRLIDLPLYYATTSRRDLKELAHELAISRTGQCTLRLTPNSWATGRTVRRRHRRPSAALATFRRERERSNSKAMVTLSDGDLGFTAFMCELSHETGWSSSPNEPRPQPRASRWGWGLLEAMSRLRSWRWARCP